MKFRKKARGKKAREIDAVQWDGTLSGWRKIVRIFPKMRTTSIKFNEVQNVARGIRIDTDEGSYHVSVCDYIVRGVKGEHYPCKPYIFEATYEKAEDAPKNIKE